MKKAFATLAAIALSMGLAFAQDLAQATETYNNGATNLNLGDKAAALKDFQSALAIASALGADGEEIVANCKEVIPTLMLSMSKDDIKAEKFEAAVASLKETAKVAREYGAENTAKDAEGLIPSVYIQQGNGLIKAKDAVAAAAAYKSALELDPANGNAALRLGQALAAAGDEEGSIAAYLTAAANGQATAANKRISTIYLKRASSSLKAKDFTAAVEQAAQANSYSESANAYKIAGTAYNSLGNKEEAVKNLSKYLELAPTAKDAAQIKSAVELLSKK